MLHRITLQHRSRLLRTNPRRYFIASGVSLLIMYSKFTIPSIGRNPPRHNLTGNVPVPGNPSNIPGVHCLGRPVPGYIRVYSFLSIGRRNSYNNNVPNPGVNSGYRRYILCRNYRNFFLSLPYINPL